MPDLTLINSLNIYSKQKRAEIRAEFEYELFGQTEIKRMVELRKEEDFREKVFWAIFNCGEEGGPYWYVAPTSTDAAAATQ